MKTNEDRRKGDAKKKSSARSLSSYMKRIVLPVNVDELAEQYKEDIWIDINNRITKSKRRTLWLRWSGVAASLLLLIGLSNYLSYNQGSKEVIAQMITVQSPVGSKSVVDLPDGTVVTLNSGSRLVYPARFTSDNRIVEIEGEGFFDVVSDAKRPFIVNAEQINVKVLGTRFNIKAYGTDETIRITLTEGKVAVGKEGVEELLTMIPGEQVLYHKEKDVFDQFEIDIKPFVSWVEGHLYFNGNTLREIANELERKFSVKINIASQQHENIIFSGDFVRNETLQQILDIITLDRPMRYRIEDGEVRIIDN